VVLLQSLFVLTYMDRRNPDITPASRLLQQSVLIMTKLLTTVLAVSNGSSFSELFIASAGKSSC